MNAVAAAAVHVLRAAGLGVVGGLFLGGGIGPVAGLLAPDPRTRPPTNGAS